MRYFLAIAFVTLLSGCQTPQEQAATDSEYCSSLAKPGTQDFRQCLIWKGQERVERRQRQSAALMNFGNSMIIAGQAPRSTMTQTTCHRNGGFLNCTSY